MKIPLSSYGLATLLLPAAIAERATSPDVYPTRESVYCTGNSFSVRV